MNYSSLLSYEDILSRGYDLKVEGRLVKGDFLTIEDAISQFCYEVVDSIVGLIEAYRGQLWTLEFIQDMCQDNLVGAALSYQDALKGAILDQAIFIYENGSKEASAIVDNNRIEYSPKAMRRLWNFGILR